MQHYDIVTDRLILDNMDMIQSVVNKFVRGKNIPIMAIEEMRDEAQLALVKAARSYDPSKGTAFTSWAYGMILHSIVNYLRSLRLYSPGKSMEDQSVPMPKYGKKRSEYAKRMIKKERIRKLREAGTLRSRIDVAAFRRGILARSGILF